MTNTVNYNLEKPFDGMQNWGQIINDNFDIIDNTIKENSDKIGDLNTLTTTDKTNVVNSINIIGTQLAENMTFLDKLRLKFVYKASGSNNTIHINTTSGNNILTLNLQAGDINDFLVGQGITIAGAKANGTDLVTKITNINGNNIQLQDNVEVNLINVICYHDDTVALKSALNDGEDVVLNGTYNIVSTLTVDISKQSLIGVNNSIIVTKIVDGSPTVDIDNTNIVYNETFITANNYVSGFKIKGTTTYQNTIGIRLKSSVDNTTLTNFTISNIGISYCSIGLQLSTRSFCNNFETMIISYCNKCVSFDSDNILGSLGERYTFTGCMFANSNISLDNIWNEFHFKGCSFDYNLYILDLLGGVVNMTNCHFEGCPGSSTQATIRVNKSINNTGNIVRIRDSYINHCGFDNNNFIHFSGDTQYGTNMYALLEDCTFDSMTTLSGYLASGNGLFRIQRTRYNQYMPPNIVYPCKLNNLIYDDFSQGSVLFDNYIVGAGITVTKNNTNKTLDIVVTDRTTATLTLLLPPTDTLLFNFKIKCQGGNGNVVRIFNKYTKVKSDGTIATSVSADTAVPEYTFNDENFHAFHNEFTNHQYIGCYAIANQVNLMPSWADKRAIVFDLWDATIGGTISLSDIEAYEI